MSDENKHLPNAICVFPKRGGSLVCAMFKNKTSSKKWMTKS